MTNSSSIDLSKCKLVNHLWPQFVERLGIAKAHIAIGQAFDLQRMQGEKGTLPVLLIETCGLALFSIDALHSQTGLVCHGQGMVLIISTKEKLIQLLKES